MASNYYPLPNYGTLPATPQFNPASVMGGSPVYYGYQIGAQDPSLSYNPDLTTNDPNRIFRNAQNVGYNLGAGIDASLYNQGQQYNQLWQGYGNAMNTAAAQLQQTPGYTQEEANNIIRDPQFNGLAATPDQYAALAPTAAESAQMQGNPNSYFNYFNPQNINDVNASQAAMQRNAVDLSEAGINTALQNEQSAYNQAIDPNKLAASNAYQNDISNVLTATGNQLNSSLQNATGRLDSAAATPGLNVTSNYLKQAGLSDAQVQQIADQGARDVGNRYQAQMNDVARQAAASGNASPLAVGALQSRLAQQSATQAADARTDAYLNALAAQRQAATGIQQTQLNAAQYQAGLGTQQGQYLGSLGSQNAQYAGNLASQDVQNVENTRLGAQQYLTGAQMQAAGNIGQQAQQGAQYVGGLRLGSENSIGNSQMQGQQYITNTGTGITQAADTASSNRGYNAYGIRQGNQQYQINNTYGQGMGINSALSNNYANVAGQRINGQNNYLNWATGQTGGYLGAQQNNNQQRIQNYGTMTNSMNSNARDWANYSNASSGQGFWSKFQNAAGSTLGSFLGNPSNWNGSGRG